MLSNYKRDIVTKVISQIEINPIQYNQEYINSIHTVDDNIFKQTNYLRLGYLFGIIQEIPKSILEIGYGKGFFLEAASKIVPKVCGYDIVEESQVPLHCKKVDSIYDEYDVICMFDVLEHFENLDFLKNLNAKFLYISVPFCHYNAIEKYENSEKADIWFENWKHRKPNEHLHHFDENALVATLQLNGWEPYSGSFIEDTTRSKREINLDPESLPNILSMVFTKF